MLNFHQDRDLEESVITLSHEVAHNFNASHDDTFEDNAECYNKGFIMDELLNATDSDHEGITCPVLYIEVTTIKLCGTFHEPPQRALCKGPSINDVIP